MHGKPAFDLCIYLSRKVLDLIHQSTEWKQRLPSYPMFRIACCGGYFHLRRNVNEVKVCVSKVKFSIVTVDEAYLVERRHRSTNKLKSLLHKGQFCFWSFEVYASSSFFLTRCFFLQEGDPKRMKENEQKMTVNHPYVVSALKKTCMPRRNITYDLYI